MRVEVHNKITLTVFDANKNGEEIRSGFLDSHSIYFHLFPFESSYWRQEGGVAAVTALVRLERCPFLRGGILVGDGEVLVRIEEHFDETKHRGRSQYPPGSQLCLR